MENWIALKDKEYNEFGIDLRVHLILDQAFIVVIGQALKNQVPRLHMMFLSSTFVITKYANIHDDKNNPLIHYQIRTKFDGIEYQVWTQCREYPTGEANELTRSELEPIVLVLLESMGLNKDH